MQKNSSMEAIPTKTQAKNIQKNSSKEAMPGFQNQSQKQKTQFTLNV